MSLVFGAGEQLGQDRPSASASVSIYTGVLRSEITSVVICNTTGGAAKFSIYHDDDGSTFDQNTALHYQQSIGGNETIHITSDAVGAGWFVNKNGQIGIQTNVPNALTFTVYGITEDIARYRGRRD